MVDNCCIFSSILQKSVSHLCKFHWNPWEAFPTLFIESKYTQEWIQKHGCNCNNACILLFWEWTTLVIGKLFIQKSFPTGWMAKSERQGLCQFPSTQPPDPLCLPNKYSGKTRGILLKILLKISLSVEKCWSDFSE